MEAESDPVEAPMTTPAQRQAGQAQITAMELVESLVAHRSEGGKFERRAVVAVFDNLSDEQREIAFTGLADIASAAVSAWKKRDPVGADLYMATRRMLAGHMTGETDDHDHGDSHDDDFDSSAHAHVH
jgi:hypothetical protein